MPNTTEKVNRLEVLMAELAEAQLRTQASLKSLSEGATESRLETEASLRTLSDRLAKSREEAEASLKTLSDRLAETRREAEASLGESRQEMQASLRTLSDRLAESRQEAEASSNRLSEAQAKTEASLDRLSEAQAKTEASLDRLSEAQAKTDVSLNRLSDEMREFKDEMGEFKDEMREERKQMNAKWGELVNKLGTLVEDIVAPNIPRIAKEYFGVNDIEFFAVRPKVRNKRDRSKRQEFDVIATGDDKFIINETKLKPKSDHVNDFVELLGQVEEYFPEHADKTIIPIFASLYIDQSIVNYLTQNQIYAMIGDETMNIVNFERVSDRKAE